MRDLRAKWAADLGLGKNPTAQFGAPVSFTANLSSITPGQTQVLSTNGLANGYRTPYVIDEIRMQAYMVTPSATILQPSYAVKFQFRTGAYAFSQTAVPMMLHTPRFALAPWVPAGLGTGLTSYSRGPMLMANYTGGLYQCGDEARWHLPKPLWMAPGDQIQCSVERDLTAASSSNGAFAVDVTYVGRSLKPGTPGPKVRYVPWIASTTFNLDDSFKQVGNDFRNPFPVPLQVQRFVGRPLSDATSGLFNTSGATAGLAISTTPYAKVFIVDSLGYKVTNDFIPAGNVFDTERCAWTFQRPLGSNEQFDIQFQRAGTGAGTDQLYGVAMIGHREESGQ